MKINSNSSTLLIILLCTFGLPVILLAGVVKLWSGFKNINK